MKRCSPIPRSLQAALGLAVIVLQVLSALHFTLVRHGYSAALGGVVHVHESARSAQKSAPKAALPRTAALVAHTPACSTELCPDANAPAGAAPHFELLLAGSAAFGAVRLPSERAACTSESRRVFLSAPKTSPPV
ncbi:MAG TPA: hypothetical protein VHM25_10470 [Polyangiaceae bacterium]|nr:hypothetical protein [Polyangiaceae bacterium]